MRISNGGAPQILPDLPHHPNKKRPLGSLRDPPWRSVFLSSFRSLRKTGAPGCPGAPEVCVLNLSRNDPRPASPVRAQHADGGGARSNLSRLRRAEGVKKSGQNLVGGREEGFHFLLAADGDPAHGRPARPMAAQETSDELADGAGPSDPQGWLAQATSYCDTDAGFLLFCGCCPA